MNIESKVIKNDTPLISIIIPVYNVEKYIEKCISSVVNQSYKNLEIIIINDGTKDNSGAICEKYASKDSRIKYYIQKNEGLSSARNKGLDNMSGDYVFLVDSDDYLALNAIEEMYKEAKESKADIVCCSSLMYYEDNTQKDFVWGNEKLLLEKGEAIKYCLFSNTVSSVPWAKLYKSSLFENIRYPINRLNEDEYVTYKLVLNANLVSCLEESYYMHLQNTEGLVQSGKTEEKMDFFLAWDEREEYLRKLKHDEYADSTLELIVREAYKRKNKMQQSQNRDEVKNILIKSRKKILFNNKIYLMKKLKLIIKIQIIMFCF